MPRKRNGKTARSSELQRPLRPGADADLGSEQEERRNQEIGSASDCRANGSTNIGGPHKLRLLPRALAQFRLGTLLLSGALAFVLKFVAAGFAYLMFVALARWMTPEAFGTFAFALSLAAFLGITATLGLGILVLKAVPVAEAEGRPGAANSFLRTAILCIAAAGAAAGLALIGIAALVPERLLPLPSGTAVPAGILVLGFALSEFFLNGMRAYGRVAWALVPREIFWRLAVVLLAGLMVWSGQTELGAPTALWVAASILGLVTISQAVALWAGLPAETRQALPVGDWPGWRRAALGTWGVIVAGASSAHLGVVMVGLLLETTTAGTFLAAQRTATLLSMPLIALNIVAAPIFAKLYASATSVSNGLAEASSGNSDGITETRAVSDSARLQALCARGVLATAALTFLGVAILAFAGDYLLMLFDPAYGAAHDVLMILALGHLVNALAGPSGILMMMTGHERPFLWISLFSEVLGLALIAGLGSVFGLEGAAAGAAIAMIVWNLASTLYVRRHLGIDTTVLVAIRRLKPTKTAGRAGGVTKRELTNTDKSIGPT